MKVFLSWSGERSQAIAEALRDWLPKVIQAVQPWMSAADIERGARWSSDIAAELEQTRFGILCLTPENLESMWIHFEAGALSKTIEKTFVCPYLFELEPADLKGPLVQFNAARAHKEETRKLVLTINAAQETPLFKATIEESYEVWWPKLEKRFGHLPAIHSQVKTKRPEREILEEILELAREQAKVKTPSIDVSKSLDFAAIQRAVRVPSKISVKGFLPGTCVQHYSYGRGVVVSRKGNNDDAKLIVNFPGCGQIELVERHAGLIKA